MPTAGDRSLAAQQGCHPEFGLDPVSVESIPSRTTSQPPIKTVNVRLVPPRIIPRSSTDLVNGPSLALSISGALEAMPKPAVIIPPTIWSDADPWCNCQDYPDKFWGALELDDLQVRRFTVEQIVVTANLSFFGPEHPASYRVELEKSSSGWRINALEGFAGK